MLNLKPIEDDLRCSLLPRGDEVVILQDYLTENGYKLLEMCEFIDEFDWGKYEGGKDDV